MDVVGHPSPAGVAHRWAQLEHERLRLLVRMEIEQLVDAPPPPPRTGSLIGPLTVPRLTRPPRPED